MLQEHKGCIFNEADRLQMELVNPDKEWKVEGSFFTRQSEMDIRMKWRESADKSQLLG